MGQRGTQPSTGAPRCLVNWIQNCPSEHWGSHDASPGAGRLTLSHPPGQRTPTMYDVAALAQVSIKTVSRVINQRPSVSPEIAQRVQDAVQMLDYHPNAAAISLRRPDHKTFTVGLLLEDVANPFSSALHRAVEDTAARHGMLVFAGSSDEDPRRAREVIAAFASHRVDGLIVMPAGGHRDWLLVDQQRQGKPVVIVDRLVDFLHTD